MNPPSESVASLLQRLSLQLAGCGDRLVTGQGDPAPADTADPPGLRCPVAVARTLRRLHRRRASIFGAALFPDPAWDILLDLFVADADGRRICVSSASIASGAPQTTGSRWLAALETAGLIRRKPDPEDARRVVVRLTDHARSKLTAVLSDIGIG